MLLVTFGCQCNDVSFNSIYVCIFFCVCLLLSLDVRVTCIYVVIALNCWIACMLVKL